MLHCTSMMCDNIWYLEDYGMVVIGNFYNEAFLCENIYDALSAIWKLYHQSGLRVYAKKPRFVRLVNLWSKTPSFL